MLRISKARAPRGFRAEVTEKGKVHLAARPKGKLPGLWRNYKDAFYDAYHGICAYSATQINRVHGFHMDHFLPTSNPRYRHLAYTWSNFRLASPCINSKKGDAIIADPFTLPDQACRISFLTGKMTLNPNLPESQRKLLEKTIRRLGLNEGASMQNRVKAFGDYRRHAKHRNGETTTHRRGSMNVIFLTENYPFVASEMLRLGLIAPKDCGPCRQLLSKLGFAAFKQSSSSNKSSSSP